MVSLGWTLNSGSDLAFTGILFLFIFNENNTFFFFLVQFRQSTFCRPTILCDVLSILFAVTLICCTCCLDKQPDICDVSLCFVAQVTFSPLSVVFIFLQWSRGPFLQCNVLFTGNELIFIEKWPIPTVTRGNNGGSSMSCSQSILLFL